MAVASAIGLYRNILWQACAKKEATEIQAAFKVFPMATAQTRADGVEISEASNIPAAPSAASDARKPVEKFAGKVSFVFVSRVSPKKNVKAAIEMVSSLQGEVAFDIFGPVDDSEYWEQCSKLLAQSPANVKIRYLGPLQHAEVGKTFSQYHFFLFPTLGENFGHVIVESLGSGCPVIVSDRTPWNGLDRKNVGWDLPLNEPGSWHRVLQDCVDMNSETYQNMSKASVQFVRSWLNSAKIIDDNIAMFQRALSLNSNK